MSFNTNFKPGNFGFDSRKDIDEIRRKADLKAASKDRENTSENFNHLAELNRSLICICMFLIIIKTIGNLITPPPSIPVYEVHYMKFDTTYGAINHIKVMYAIYRNGTRYVTEKELEGIATARLKLFPSIGSSPVLFYTQGDNIEVQHLMVSNVEIQ